jgi:hypothetical protein
LFTVPGIKAHPAPGMLPRERGDAMTSNGDDHAHAATMERRLGELSASLRRDVGRLGDARAKAMFETAAEVVDGLEQAFRHYRRQSEPAWRDGDD